MNINELVIETVAILTPYLAKSGEAIAEKIGEDLWGSIKKMFKTDPRSTELEHFGTDAITPEQLMVLRKLLEDKLRNDKSIVPLLAEKIQQAKQNNPGFRKIDTKVYIEKNLDGGIININFDDL